MNEKEKELWKQARENVLSKAIPRSEYYTRVRKEWERLKKEST